MVTWADLVEAERDVMMLASEEAPVWEVCAKQGRLDGSTRPPIEPAAGQATVRRLADLGLVAFYALGEPDSDLSDLEVAELFESSDAWSGEAALQTGVLLYLTPVGEGLYYDGSGT